MVVQNQGKPDRKKNVLYERQLLQLIDGKQSSFQKFLEKNIFIHQSIHKLIYGLKFYFHNIVFLYYYY